MSPQGAVLLDPYAKAIIGRREFGQLGPVRLLWPYALYGTLSMEIASTLHWRLKRLLHACGPTAWAGYRHARG